MAEEFTLFVSGLALFAILAWSTVIVTTFM